MKWISSKPLESFSSFHEGALCNFFGLKIYRFSCEISFNNETALTLKSTPTLTIHSHPSDCPTMVPRVDLLIDHLTQWELDLTLFKSFSDYLAHLNYKHRYNYSRTEKSFSDYGCQVSLIEGDWSAYAEGAYALYHNIASKYMPIYDLEFFRAIAKLPNYKLICAWFEKKLIGIIVVAEETFTTHSMLCGLDYMHSKKSFAYSKLHYEFIRQAIDTGRFKVADVGVTADHAKKTLGFAPKPAVVEIYAPGIFLSNILRLANLFLKFSINSQNAVCVSLRWPWRS